MCSIREPSIFSIMADETRDISNQEQIIVFAFVGLIQGLQSKHEDFIGMVHVD